MARLDLIGNSAVTIRDYGTTVYERKLILELKQGGFPTNCPPWWLALYGHLQFFGNIGQTKFSPLHPIFSYIVFFNGRNPYQKYHGCWLVCWLRA
jgi:hypothetical protein